MSKLLNIAFSQYGVSEFPGESNNDEILKYFKSVGKVYSDETAWCSAFTNWCCKEAGLPISGRLNARSWCKIGKGVETPELGDIIVLWRESLSSWKGHVGIYINEQDEYYNVLGGNQNNCVCIKKYPKHRILGFRRLE